MREGFDPNAANTWNEEERAAYETGHREGESCRQADWSCALDEACNLPDDVDADDPWSVARYIAKLQGQADSSTVERGP